MPDSKISAGADPGTLVSTDKLPLARVASTTAYSATMAEISTFTNGGLPYEVSAPSMAGIASPGTAATVSRGDHIHATDSNRVSKSGDTMSGPLVGITATFTTYQSGPGGPTWTSGTGAPTATAPIGSLYSRTDGTVGATLYVRGASAWTAVAGV